MDLSKSYEYFQPEKVDARIHIVGCGSVGATIAENLVRLGLTNIALWDMDVVNPHNLANQIFRQQDVGRSKVEALADILFELNPEVKDELKLYPDGWNGQKLSGYVFLCVDNIELKEFGAPFSINASKTRYGSSAGRNWNLGVMLNKDNEITVGYKKKRQFQSMMYNYISDKRNGVAWPREDIMAMQGLHSYYRMVEPEAIDAIVKHTNEKLGVDVLLTIKEDLR